MIKKVIISKDGLEELKKELEIWEKTSDIDLLKFE